MKSIEIKNVYSIMDHTEVVGVAKGSLRKGDILEDDIGNEIEIMGFSIPTPLWHKTSIGYLIRTKLCIKELLGSTFTCND